MRQALNDNPMVQMAVLGLAAVVLAFVVFTSVLKKDDAGAGATAAADPAAATADPAAATVDPAATADPATSGTAAPPATTTAPPADPGASGGRLASKGVPKELLAAYARGDAIALVVIDPKAEGSKQFARVAKSFEDDDVRVFVVDVNDIAEYSRITQGVAVSRTPALVVVRPRKLNEGAPMATVTYGFRSPRSIRQAIDDAFYAGGNVPAYPSG